MTIQIGLLGAKCLVLAGDTRQYREPKTPLKRSWYSYRSSKIKMNNARRIAVACARDMDASFRVAETVLSELSACDTESRATRIKEIGIDKAHGHDSECIVAFADPLPALYVFQCAGNGDAECLEFHDKFVIGDPGNPACFWAERYYRASLRISELTRLAAHIVIAAGKINNGSIGGLEIVTLDQTSLRRWSEDENAALMSEIEEAGNRIGNFVLGSGEAQLING